MLKRIIKAVSVAITIVCLVVCMLPTYAFADVVEFTEAAKMGATIVDLYGMANNTSLAYEAISDGSALTLIENLYTEYSSSASDPYTLAAIGAAAAAAGAIAVVYDAVTGKGYVQLYQTQYISSLDGFWDYTLSDLGLSRNNDDLFEFPVSNGDVSPVSVPLNSLGGFFAQPISASYVGGASSESIYQDAQYAFSIQDPLISGGSLIYKVAYRDPPANSNCYYFVSTTSPNNFLLITFISDAPAKNIVAYQNHPWNNPDQWGVYDSGAIESSFNSNYGYYISNLTLSEHLDSSANIAAPLFTGNLNNYEAGLAAFAAFDTAGTAVVCQPDFYIGDPLTADPVITVPNPSSPDYIPSPQRINTDIEWLPEWGDPYGVPDPEPGVPYPVTDPFILNDAVPGIWSEVVAGTSVTPNPDPDPDPDPNPDPDNPSPDEVFNPLLPVTLPSFNFSFSGIWHYVREWVSSLGAWFTTLFTIWSHLPFAMVVPVYATAVVVIVLGVYKRFFM